MMELIEMRLTARAVGVVLAVMALSVITISGSFAQQVSRQADRQCLVCLAKTAACGNLVACQRSCVRGGEFRECKRDCRASRKACKQPCSGDAGGTKKNCELTCDRDYDRCRRSCDPVKESCRSDCKNTAMATDCKTTCGPCWSLLVRD